MQRVEVTPVDRPIRGVQPGEPLSVSIKEAKILVALKRATYYTKPAKPKAQAKPKPEPIPEPEPEVVEAEASQTSLEYERRDMVAEGD